MKKNRAEKIVVKREREWSETELLGKKRMAEAVFGGDRCGNKAGNRGAEDDCCGGGNAPPSEEKLSGK